VGVVVAVDPYDDDVCVYRVGVLDDVLVWDAVTNRTLDVDPGGGRPPLGLREGVAVPVFGLDGDQFLRAEPGFAVGPPVDDREDIHRRFPLAREGNGRLDGIACILAPVGRDEDRFRHVGGYAPAGITLSGRSRLAGSENPVDGSEAVSRPRGDSSQVVGPACPLGNGPSTTRRSSAAVGTTDSSTFEGRSRSC
jgi:hypothetical protein